MRNKRLIAELSRIQDKLKYSHESKIIEHAIRELMDMESQDIPLGDKSHWILHNERYKDHSLRIRKFLEIALGKMKQLHSEMCPKCPQEHLVIELTHFLEEELKNLRHEYHPRISSDTASTMQSVSHCHVSTPMHRQCHNPLVFSSAKSCNRQDLSDVVQKKYEKHPFLGQLPLNIPTQFYISVSSSPSISVVDHTLAPEEGK